MIIVESEEYSSLHRRDENDFKKFRTIVKHPVTKVPLTKAISNPLTLHSYLEPVVRESKRLTSWYTSTVNEIQNRSTEEYCLGDNLVRELDEIHFNVRFLSWTERLGIR